MKRKETIIDINVLSWDKYNYRKDVSNPSWFRVNNNMVQDSKIYQLSNGAFRLFMCILCECSANNSSCISTYLSKMCIFGKCRADRWVNLANELQQLQLLTYSIRNAEVTSTCSTDKQDKQTFRVAKATSANAMHNNYKKENKNELKNDDGNGFDYEAFKELWNSSCGELPKINQVTKKRKQAIKQRLNEQPVFGYWKKVIEILSASNFCNGSNDRNWKANFDFLIKPDTHIKAIEGVYGEQRKKTWFEREMENFDENRRQ